MRPRLLDAAGRCMLPQQQLGNCQIINTTGRRDGSQSLGELAAIIRHETIRAAELAPKVRCLHPASCMAWLAFCYSSICGCFKWPGTDICSRAGVKQGDAVAI